MRLKPKNTQRALDYNSQIKRLGRHAGTREKLQDKPEYEKYFTC